jgi:hypothetical protein
VLQIVWRSFNEISYGGLGKELTFHLLSWSKVWFSISEKGLGVRNLQMFNRALLGKCLWHVHEGEAWWKLNFAVCVVGVVLMSMLGRMGWGYGRILGGAGGSFKSYQF